MRILTAVFACIGVAVVALYVGVRLIDMRPNLRWWRKYNPWILREYIAIFAHDMSHTNTDEEQDYRYLVGVLSGERDPLTYSRRYSVKGSTLCIDMTSKGGGTSWVPKDTESPDLKPVP